MPLHGVDLDSLWWMHGGNEKGRLSVPQFAQSAKGL